MKIKLPYDNYIFEDGSAEIKEGILYIHWPTAFKSVMYALTYMCYGKDECYFCHRKLKPDLNSNDSDKYFKNITLDHLIPQEFGGPTIPDNMRPTCSKCNSSKGNLFPDEFEEMRMYMGLKEKASLKLKKKYQDEILKRQELRHKGEIESIPEEWLTPNMDIKRIFTTVWIHEGLGSSYTKQQRMLSMYKCCQKPLIVSSNYYLFDGFYTLLLSKMEEVGESLKIIYLENVVYDGFRTDVV